MTNFDIETKLIEVEAASSVLEELLVARPTTANEPLAWANRHLSNAIDSLRQVVDYDQTGRPPLDISGQRFGKLVAIEPFDMRTNRCSE